MKKKLLEKDGFYLALFVCICLVAIGGVWFTKNNVEELTSNDLFVNKTNENVKKEDDEVHLIEKETNKDDFVYTAFMFIPKDPSQFFLAESKFFALPFNHIAESVHT